MTMIIRLPVKTKTIPAGTFKARCLALMDEVAAKRQAIVITKRGKPVAKLVPVEKEKDEIFGFMKGKVTVNGDIVGPILTPEEWGDLY
jgi:prevent-host-death family protein